MLGFNNGTLTKLHQLKSQPDSAITDKDYQDDIRFFAYDMLYGKNYIFGGNKPYIATDLQMGTIPIEIETIKVMGNSIYVQGSGFTDKSKIFINGEKLGSTVMLSQYSLMASDIAINEGDSVSVGQASSKREVLSYSNSITYSLSEHFIDSTLDNGTISR